jgi:hypothetical protein
VETSKRACILFVVPKSVAGTEAGGFVLFGWKHCIDNHGDDGKQKTKCVIL